MYRGALRMQGNYSVVFDEKVNLIRKKYDHGQQMGICSRGHTGITGLSYKHQSCYFRAYVLPIS